MFRRTSTDIPEDVSFPADLTALGIRRDLRGLYVQVEHPDKFYQYEQFATKAANDKLHEAVHEAIRNDVYEMLRKRGVDLIYAWRNGVSINHEPENEPKIKMLMGGYNANTNDVLIFIGDSRRELGIISRLTIATTGGTRGGSFIGVLDLLRMYNPADWVPSLVVLNPGELLYSHETQTSMTSDTWNTRKRPHAFAEPYAVKEQNKVRRHATPQEHVKTFFDDILQGIFKDKRINVIAVGDGGENLLEYLNDKLTHDPDAKIGQLLATVTLVNSSHDDDKFQNAKLKKFMAKHGRAWVSSQEPKNKVLGKVSAEFARYVREEQKQESPETEAPYSVSSPEPSPLDYSKRGVPSVGRARTTSSLSEGLHQQQRAGGPDNDIGRIDHDVFDSSSFGSDQEPDSEDGGVKLPPFISDTNMAARGLTMKEYREFSDSDHQHRRLSNASVCDPGIANPNQYRISYPSRPSRTLGPGLSQPIRIPVAASAAAKKVREKEKEKEARKKEKEALQKEKETLQKEKETLQKERESRQKEKEKEGHQKKLCKTSEAKNALDDAIAVAEREMMEMAERNAKQAAETVANESTTQEFPFPTIPDQSTATEGNEDPTDPNQAYDYYGKPCICTTVSAGIEDITEGIFPAVVDEVLDFIYEEKYQKGLKWSLAAFREHELRETLAQLALQPGPFTRRR